MNILRSRVAGAPAAMALVLAVALLNAAPAGLAADQPSASQTPAAPPPRLGIAGGAFTCALPADWSRQDDERKPGDQTYELLLLGPRAENAPVMIFVSFFGAGNNEFKDYADFVTRNTTDLWSDQPKAEARKITLHGRNALTFEFEQRTFLHPESKSDESVVIREKFYVLLAKDRVGFFVLHYSAPKSVFAEHLPVFERVANSFALL